MDIHDNLDAKDKIIFQQLDVIRSMTEHNIRRISDDFWGTPVPTTPTPPPSTPSTPEPEKTTSQASQAPAPEANQEPAAEEAPPETIDDLKAELNSYVGLDSIKKEVSSLINMVTVYKLRKQHDLPTVDVSLHMVFTGNPGTGKTMIARLMARIYKCLGILSKGQLVEVDRSGLVAGYVGQTAIKTSEVIQKSLGGVLFIDEAYALNGGGETDFGQEAIETLLKAMEDHRDDLVVIVAGYDDLMNDFIHSNPGLESRFNRYLYFEDYTIDEMLQIFQMQCKKGCYTMDDAASEAVHSYIMAENFACTTFGNARGVRNIFEKVLAMQNNRLAAMDTVTRDDLMAIKDIDVYQARGIEPPTFSKEDDPFEKDATLDADPDIDVDAEAPTTPDEDAL